MSRSFPLCCLRNQEVIDVDPLKQLNLAMRSIEANLAGEPSIQEAAQIAGCSEYHFRRMFSFLAGMPLGEYIRRRRLTQIGRAHV